MDIEFLELMQVQIEHIIQIRLLLRPLNSRSFESIPVGWSVHIGITPETLST